MKCLIINGSGRLGASLAAARIIKEEIVQKQKDIIFEEMMLKDYEIPFCNGCFACFYHGEDKCPHYKNAAPVVQKIEECDYLIIASPVYALNVSSLIKNFFDHSAYFFHRPRFFDKKALVIVTTVGGGHTHTAKYIRDVLKYYGFNRVDKLALALFDNSILIKDSVKKKCASYANKVYKEMTSLKLHGVSLKRIIFYNMWRAMSLSKKACPSDKLYWHESGLYKHPYSPIVHLNLFNKIAGALFYRLFKIFFK